MLTHIVWLTGAFTALWGVVILFKPAWLKQVLVFFNKGKIVYAAAVLKTLLGVFFLIFARDCKQPGVIITFGILMAAGSILFCLLPFAKNTGLFELVDRKIRMALSPVGSGRHACRRSHDVRRSTQLI